MRIAAGRDFRLLWTAGLLAALGSQFAAVALPLTALAQTGSAAAAGLVGSVGIGATLLTAIPAGALADRIDQRRLMIAVESASALGTATLAVAVLTSHVTLPLLLALALVGGLLGNAYAPAANGLLVRVVPPDAIGTASAALQSRSAAARLVGPLVGGALYAVHPAVPFGVQTLGLLAAVTVLAKIRVRRAPRPAAPVPEPAAGRGAPDDGMLAGLVHVWRDGFLRTTLLVFGCALNAAFSAAMFVAVTRTAAADPHGRLTGLLTACAGAGSLLGGLLAIRLPLQRYLTTTILATCWGAAAALLALAVTPAAAMGIAFGCCMTIAALGNTAFTTVLLTRTPQHLLGRVSSGAGAISMIAQPAGPLAGGLLAERVGAGPSFLVLAGVCAAGALVATLSRQIRGAGTERVVRSAGQRLSPSTSRA